MGTQKTKWLFGMSGRQTACGATALIFLLCCSDSLFPGAVRIPSFVKYMAADGLIYAIAALGINFYSGHLGETSLGHAAFYGIGAYVTGFLTVRYGLDFWLTIPLGMAAAALFSAPVALAGRRVKGSFMVIITYACSEILHYVVMNSSVLGGTSGISGIPVPRILGVKITKLPFFSSNKDGYILILFGIVLFLACFTEAFIRSRTGYAVAAIRQDAIAAEAMGIHTGRYQLRMMMLSAAICSVAGSFYAAFSKLADPTLLSATLSIRIFTMLVIGGRRSTKGAILGAFAAVILPELLRGVQDLLGLPFDPWYILYGLMLVLIMRFRPDGLFGARGQEESYAAGN